MQDDGEHKARTDARDPVLAKDQVRTGKTIMKALPDNRGGDQPEHDDYLARGGVPYETLRAPDWLYPLILVGKLHEEVEEIREAMNDPDEYADVIIVLASLAKLNGITPEQIDASMERRVSMKGQFTLCKVMRRQF
jgi:predicted house-cleaning noncanonical NTP pyrophosphatase (MazG superfamily)